MNKHRHFWLPYERMYRDMGGSPVETVYCAYCLEERNYDELREELKNRTIKQSKKNIEELRK